MRSVLANFRKYAGRFFLLTSDFPIPVTTPNLTLSASWRLGQIPQWLDLAKHTTSGWRDGAVELSMLHHAEIFQPYQGTIFNRYVVLPNNVLGSVTLGASSLAIESQLGHVQGISDYL